MKKMLSFIVLLMAGLLITMKPVNASNGGIVVNINVDGVITEVDVSNLSKVEVVYDSYVKKIRINKFNEKGIRETFKEFENILPGKGNITFDASLKNYKVLFSDDRVLSEDPTLKGFNLNDIKIEYSSETIPIYEKGIKKGEALDTVYILILNNSIPAISGKSAIVNNIDKPKTLDEIKKAIDLQAIDDYDGDITNSIKIENDNYSSNKNKVGNYNITYSVTNSFNLKSTFVLTVANKDLTKPVIKGPNEKTYSYKDLVNIDVIKGLFSVSDNVDTKLEVDIADFILEKNTVKTYNLEIKSTDKSGNTAKKAFKLNIIDDVAPEIKDEHKGIIKVNFKDKLTDKDFLRGLTASDEVCGDLTNKIKIIENNFNNKKGIHTVKYEVVDNYSNKTTITRQYEVYSQDAPVFYISNSVLTIEDINKMSIDQLAKLLSELENIEMASFKVIEDEYSLNYNKTGSYKLSLRVTDTMGEEHLVSRDINVFSEEENSVNAKLIFKSILGTLGVLSITLVVIIKKRK